MNCVNIGVHGATIKIKKTEMHLKKQKGLKKFKTRDIRKRCWG